MPIQILQKVTAFIILTTWCLTAQSQSILAFDFGDQASPDIPYQRVSLVSRPEEFTWTTPPEYAFSRTEYSAIRKSQWIDGVAGAVLEFEVQVPDGQWWIQAGFDSGLELTSTMSIEIDGREEPLKWHNFRPRPVPSTTLYKQFRVWQGVAASSGGKIKIKFIGGEDDVRLMSFDLVAADVPDGKRQEWLADQLYDAGKLYQRHTDLEVLREGLQLELLENPDDSWAYWYLKQVDLLRMGEEIFANKGWEWVKRQTNMSFIDRTQLGGMILEPILAIQDHPFEERARWLRAKFLFHLNLEYGHDPERARALEDIALLRERYPNDTLLRMYEGELFELDLFPGEASPNQNAPVWSQLQYKSLHRLRALVHYWVEERQAINGELGGKLGDDVEALRFWLPLVYTGDSIAIKGWRRLADGVWHSPEVYKGYARRVDDVEHASEFITDSAPLMLLISDDTAYHNRVLPTLDHFTNLWTAYSPAGNRLFKSAWYSSTEVDTRPPRDRDVHYNARALSPLRYWMLRYPQDKRVLEPMNELGRSWAIIARSTDKGKPAGILPPSIRLTDESINGDEPTWYHANMYWEYYNFNGNGRMLDHLLYCWQFSKDPVLLEPLVASLELIRNSYIPDIEDEIGTPEWAATQFVTTPGFWGVIGQWRMLTNDKSYDDLLMQYGSPYIQFLITGDVDKLTPGLEHFNTTVSTNWPMLTEEVMFTDRILIARALGRGRVNSSIIKSMLTGEAIEGGTSPYVCTTWKHTFEGFTALVKDYSKTSLTIDIFNHGSTTEEATMRIWHLEPGNYSIQFSNGNTGNFTMTNPGSELHIDCAPGELFTLTFQLQ